jgi:hypothetical protein
MLILEELLASEEATSEDIFASLDTYLEDTSRKLDEKVDNYVELIAHFEARYELRMKRANSLLELARRDDAHKELLKERLKQFMSRTGQKRFETDSTKFDSAIMAGSCQSLFVTLRLTRLSGLTRCARLYTSPTWMRSEKLCKALSTSTTSLQRISQSLKSAAHIFESSEVNHGRQASTAD